MEELLRQQTHHPSVCQKGGKVKDRERRKRRERSKEEDKGLLEEKDCVRQEIKIKFKKALRQRKETERERACHFKLTTRKRHF